MTTPKTRIGFWADADVNGSQDEFTTVFVKLPCDSVTEDDLKNVLGIYGEITRAVVTKNVNGKSRGNGLVNFKSHESAVAAVESLSRNNTIIDGKVWYVERAHSNVERASDKKLALSSLYVKNFKEDVDDRKLEELFSKFGTIKSCKVMLDPEGLSCCCGFVMFSMPEEAAKARGEMHGKVVGREPLFVACAKRKKLEEHLSRIRRTSTTSKTASPSGTS